MGIVKSAGLVILYEEDILLVHPTGAAWEGTFSIPKGEIQDFESPLEAAIRETKEEIGLDLSEQFKGHNGIPGIIPYKKKNGNKTYKKVFYYVIKLNEKPIIKVDALQKDEVDWANFVHKSEAKHRIFWRFLPILEQVFE